MDTKGGDVTGAAAVVTVPDDRPVRHRQPRLRRPASWSLGLGAASLAPLSWAAFRPETERLVTWGTPTSGGSVDLAGPLFFVAGCLACVWLVRLQGLLARTNRIGTTATDFGLWVMWGLPLVMSILPGIRISGWDKAMHGRRSWTVTAWALSWIPCSTFIKAPSGDRTDVPDPAQSWVHLGVSLTTFVLWTATVMRLTRGAEVVAHETGLDA
ncbi:MAG: hypothetical protein HOQ18_18215 [Dermatophilaceae bacterium]|nr:hypothetical protein [Dermatophilaceae bacterium]